MERDRKVRAHEQAHISAGANLVRGGASYSYQTGPDDRRYAVGGEVSIDASPGRTPEETISKAERIRAAALAPADPSAQDRGVAAQAGLMEAEARIELSAQRLEKTAEKPPAVSVPSEQDGARSYRAVEQTAWVFSPLGGHLNSFA